MAVTKDVGGYYDALDELKGEPNRKHIDAIHPHSGIIFPSVLWSILLMSKCISFSDMIPQGAGTFTGVQEVVFSPSVPSFIPSIISRRVVRHIFVGSVPLYVFELLSLRKWRRSGSEDAMDGECEQVKDDTTIPIGRDAAISSPIRELTTLRDVPQMR